MYNISFKYFKLIIIFLFLLFLPATTTFAVNKESDFTFQMSIIFPNNQTNRNISYFDLKVEPKKKQELSLSITNTGKETKKIKIKPSDSWTNQDGKIIYEKDLHDNETVNTSSFPFSTLIKEKSKVVEIQPGKNKVVSFTLMTPEESFDGVILGAFLATTLDNENANVEGAIDNKLQIIKAVVLRESEKNVKPKFKINEIKPSIVDFQKAVSINIYNEAPIIIDDAKIRVDIYRDNIKKPIKSKIVKDVCMAPNSNFYLPISFGETSLDSGSYSVYIKIKYDMYNQEFNKKFKINKNELYKLESDSRLMIQKPKFKGYIIIGIVILIVLLSLIYINLKLKKRKKKKKKTRKKKRKNV